MEDATHKKCGNMLQRDRYSFDDADEGLIASIKEPEVLTQKAFFPEEKLEILHRENLKYAPFATRYPRLPLIISIIALIASIIRQFLP